MLKNLVLDLFLIYDDKFRELEGVLLKRGGGFTAHTHDPPHMLTCTLICNYPPYMG